MKACFLIVAMVLPFVAFAESQKKNCQHDEVTLRCCEVIRVYDGDTITVTCPNLPAIFGEKLGVRIEGIDTAERRPSKKKPEEQRACEKAKALEARQVVLNMVKEGDKVDLENVKRGKYFRVVATPRVGKTSIAQTLVNKGLATPYDGGTKAKVNWCRPLKEQRLPASKK